MPLQGKKESGGRREQNMEYRTVALIGAGAVGAFFIRGLSNTLGDNFCVIAEGERAQRLREKGLVINGEQVFPNVCSPEEATGADLILITTKYNGFHEILDSVKLMTAPHTVVVSALNGIDSEETLAEVIGEEHLLNAFMFVQSTRVGNTIDYNLDAKGLIFGDKNTPEKIIVMVSLLIARHHQYHAREYNQRAENFVPGNLLSADSG